MTFPCRKIGIERAKLWRQVELLVPSYAPLSDLFSLAFTPTFLLPHPLHIKALFCPVWKEANELIHVRMLMAESS